MVGRFAGVPDELPYLMPQDFGTRTGVRWFDLARCRRRAAHRRTARPSTLIVSATHHTSADLTAATDWLDLRRRDEVVVHVDVAKRGVGTASCGPDTLEAYRVGPGPHRWTWRLHPSRPSCRLSLDVHGSAGRADCFRSVSPRSAGRFVPEARSGRPTRSTAADGAYQLPPPPPPPPPPTPPPPPPPPLDDGAVLDDEVAESRMGAMYT